MKVSAKGLALLKEFEKFERKAYVCPAGKLTIGYGHVIQDSEENLKTAVLTEAQASTLLQRDLVRFEKAVFKAVMVPLTQHQFDALVLLCFNIGPGSLRMGTGFAGSSVAAAINSKCAESTIRTNWYKWNKVDGTTDGKDNDGDGRIDEPGEKKVAPGLVVRRQREADLYFSK